MGEKKKHKEEKRNKKEPTPTEKKIRDLRATGMSLNEIAQKLNIPRKQVEAPFSKDLEKERDAKTKNNNRESRGEASDAKRESENDAREKKESKAKKEK
jgi:DNA-binding transcriptional MerR regulator